MKKIVSSVMIVILSSVSLLQGFLYAVQTNSMSSPWTQEKALHLAQRALIWPSPAIVTQLFQAWSASAAVDILFPSRQGPDRTAFNTLLAQVKSNTFNPANTNDMFYVYQLKYYADPYQAKRKLFGLFEDIFSVNNWGDISYEDVEQLHDLLYENALGSYKDLVKKVFYNRGQPWDFAMWRFLDLFNQNKNSPNQNYAREFMQLFLMWEYRPWEGADTSGAVLNYTQTDVENLAFLITWIEADNQTKRVTINQQNINGKTYEFLTWALHTGDSFAFYNPTSGTVDGTLLQQSIGGNSGMPDNITDYIFSKRRVQIADYIGYRLLKYYITNAPSQTEIEAAAQILLDNNFDIFESVKDLLASDMMYSEKSMNELRYKNPIELVIWTLQLLHQNNVNLLDPLLKDSSILSNLGWIPYRWGSIFGRDGFDNNALFYNSYFHNQWISYVTNIIYNNAANTFDMVSLFPFTRSSQAASFPLITNNSNTFSGEFTLPATTFSVSSGAQQFTFQTQSITLPRFAIALNSWATLNITKWNLDVANNTLYVATWVVNYQSRNYPLTGLTLTWLTMTNFQRDILPSELISHLESLFLQGRTLSQNIHQSIENYLYTIPSWAADAWLPFDATYQRKKVRAILTFLLTQPEYILLSGQDIPSSTNQGNGSNFVGKNQKLVLVELFGGYDWLHGVVQKSEYDLYAADRWVLTVPRQNMIDLGEYYMNPAFSWFRTQWDSWNLRIVNRIWAFNHSMWHDTAQKQVTSADSLQKFEADWLIWRLTKNEATANNAIVLRSSDPFIMKWWKYLNIGWWSADFRNFGPLNNQEKTQHLNVVRQIMSQRTYPSTVGDLYNGAISIDQVANLSKALWWSAWGGGSFSQNLSFLSTLMDAWLWNIYYTSPWWGYDTHQNQNENNDLFNRTRNLANDLSSFFESVKNRHDVTVIVYSEFWRTTKTNGSEWTDHGQGWGYFILTNNPKLKQQMPQWVMWNLAISKDQNNWLWVWVDYRAVYDTILNSLFDINPTGIFGKDFDLLKETDKVAPHIALQNYSYRPRNGSTVDLQLHFAVQDVNFNSQMSSYPKLYYGNSLSNLREYNQRNLERKEYKPWHYSIDINNIAAWTGYFYALKLYDNQYNEFVYTWQIDVPRVRASMTWNRTGDLVLQGQQISSSWQAMTTINLAQNPGNTPLTIAWKNNISIQFATGTTTITSVSTQSWSSWNWGLLQAREIEQGHFISDAAVVSGQLLQWTQILKVVGVWSDALGVNMQLNQDVVLDIPLWTWNSSNLHVISSTDWINWTLHDPAKVRKQWNNLQISTNHFSYYAIIADDLTCQISIYPTTVEQNRATTISWNAVGAWQRSLNQWIGSVATSWAMQYFPSVNSGTVNIQMQTTNAFGQQQCGGNISVVPSSFALTGVTIVNSWTVLNNMSLWLAYSWTTWITGQNDFVRFSLWDKHDFFGYPMINAAWTTVWTVSISTWTVAYMPLSGEYQFYKSYLSWLATIIEGWKQRIFLAWTRLWNDDTILLSSPATIIFTWMQSAQQLATRKNDQDTWKYEGIQWNACTPVFPGHCVYRSGNDVIVQTYHLTDFALTTLENDQWGSSAGGSWQWWSGGGWGWGYGRDWLAVYNPYVWKSVDYCPKWDSSWDSYDWSCNKTDIKITIPVNSDPFQEYVEDIVTNIEKPSVIRPNNDTPIDSTTTAQTEVTLNSINALKDKINQEIPAMKALNEYVIWLIQKYLKAWVDQKQLIAFVKSYIDFVNEFKKYKSWIVQRSAVVEKVRILIDYYTVVKKSAANKKRPLPSTPQTTTLSWWLSSDITKKVATLFFPQIELQNVELKSYWLETKTLFDGLKADMIANPQKYNLSDVASFELIKQNAVNAFLEAQTGVDKTFQGVKTLIDQLKKLKKI